MGNNLQQIHELGQSIWLDFIDRKIMHSGKLKQLINEDAVTGVTSNPAIFEKAISSSSDYNEDIKYFGEAAKSADDIFYSMAVKDIQEAADLFKGVYETGEVKGADGYVSLEVSPRLALDTEGTTAQAMELWEAVDRKNVMIKIPGTTECLPSIQKCIAEGINVNVTLLFGLKRYEEVTEAYITGLEKRLNKGLPLESIASVASFFLSRIDVMVDPILEQKGLIKLKGKVAIACAKKAYEIYKRVFGSERFKKLQAHGAKPQRLLWASTSSKNPAFKDTMYVEALIGEKTVNTIPMETLEAFRDHGIAKLTLEEDMQQADELMGTLHSEGINIEYIADKLVTEGIEKFNQPYDKLLQAIKKQLEPVAP